MEIKETDPIKVLFISHVGPYWTIGKVVSQVQDFMRKEDQEGPMFVRYLRDPRRGAGASLQSEIGFIVHGECQTKSPFEWAQRAGTRVASMVVMGRTPMPQRDYEVIERWLHGRGYEPHGPITEYYRSPRSADKIGAQQTEIQVSFRPITTRADKTDRSALTKKPRTAEIPSARHVDPTHAGMTAIGPTTQPVTDEATPTQESSASRNESQASESATRESMAALMVSKRYERIALVIMPEHIALPSAFQLWLGQVVFRIQAAAQGIKQVYPGQGEAVSELARALTSRYKAKPARFTLDPLNQVIVRFDNRNDPQAEQKRVVMQDLDTLLGRISLRTINAEESRKKIADILQRVGDLVTAQKGGAEEEPAP